MKFFKKNKSLFIFGVLIVIIIVKFVSNYRPSTKVLKIISHANTKHKYCLIPQYKEFYTDMLLENVQCPNSSNLVMINNGRVEVQKDLVCTYECIDWNTDFNYKLSDKKKLIHLGPVPCQYFNVNCQSKHTGEFKNQLILAGLKHDNLIDESKSILKGMTKPLDVLILGIDSMSYYAFKHHLPRTFSILHKELNGVSFTKFNTMGDGTTANLQSLLTGTKDTETYETRRRISGAKSVDGYNWIWNHYKKHGYLTQYYEEMTDYGTFQYRLLGFEKQPTDIYLRTFLMFAERNRVVKNFCLGNKPMHSEILRFYNETVKENFQAPSFSFIFFSLASHDDNKYSSYMDKDIGQFILDLRRNNPNQVIFLYSDHGHRFNSRLSMQGKYEERLPFLGISLPNSLNHLKSVLEINSKILISGLDVHATLEDILGIYKPRIRNRHMSLFRPLPEDRSCSDIESAAHWCACLNWNEIPSSNYDKTISTIAADIAEQISNFSLNERDVCAQLTLDKIISLYEITANEEVLKFKKSADVDGFVPDMSDETETSHVWFRIILRTKPGDAIFEVTVAVKAQDFADKKSIIHVDKVSSGDISRINRFAPWIKCLNKVAGRQSKISDIRKFCICKDAL